LCPGKIHSRSSQKPVWIDYQDGNLSRGEALKMMVTAFVKARKNSRTGDLP
jgi:hypothetical protein